MSTVGGDDLLTYVENGNPKLGQLLRSYIIPAIQRLGTNTAASPNGAIPTPAPPAGLSVKVAGETAHITINDPQPLQRGAQYHVELSTNPQFSQPHVEHLGSSRGRFINLPTNDDGGQPHNWYARSYLQYQGSQPSTPTYFGGSAPVPFQMAGTTNLTPLPSTGSGTASTDGTQGGSGLGKVIYRPAPAPKRAVNGS
jgi:hypothetical protein